MPRNSHKPAMLPTTSGRVLIMERAIKAQSRCEPFTSEQLDIEGFEVVAHGNFLSNPVHPCLPQVHRVVRPTWPLPERSASSHHAILPRHGPLHHAQGVPKGPQRANRVVRDYSPTLNNSSNSQPF